MGGVCGKDEFARLMADIYSERREPEMEKVSQGVGFRVWVSGTIKIIIIMLATRNQVQDTSFSVQFVP